MDILNREKDLFPVLKELCRKNGRILETDKAGQIRTADKYNNCDSHTFPDIESALTWERGYRTYERRK